MLSKTPHWQVEVVVNYSFITKIDFDLARSDIRESVLRNIIYYRFSEMNPFMDLLPAKSIL